MRSGRRSGRVGRWSRCRGQKRRGWGRWVSCRFGSWRRCGRRKCRVTGGRVCCGWRCVRCGEQCGEVCSGVAGRIICSRRVGWGWGRRVIRRWGSSRVCGWEVCARWLAGRWRGGMHSRCACRRRLSHGGGESRGHGGWWERFIATGTTDIQVCSRSRVHRLSGRWVFARICRLLVLWIFPAINCLICETRTNLPLRIGSQVRIHTAFWLQFPVIFYRRPAREALTILLSENVTQIFDLDTKTFDILHGATILRQLIPSIDITQDQVILVVHLRVFTS